MGENSENRKKVVNEVNATSSDDGSNLLNEKEMFQTSNSSQNEKKSVEEVEESSEADKGNEILRLPLARVKKIMKADPVLGLASQDSVFLIAKATELFIESLVVEAYQNMVNSKKKTIARRDFDSCIEKIDSLAFLDGALED